MLRTRIMLAVALAALGFVPEAGAVGRPPSAALGLPGVVSQDGSVRYVALRDGLDATAIEARSVATGTVLRRQVVQARVGIPVAAGTTGTGLSPDGRTLVLGTFHSPNPDQIASRTTLVVLSTSLRAQPRTFVLRGDFAVDALSPHARWLYLIESRRGGLLDYAVRAFDLRAGTLVPGDVVDRREPDEKMTGYPVARMTTGNGRYAFTIYDGLGQSSFVHALDTVTRTAHCLDLPGSVAETAIWNLRFRLSPDGSRLMIAQPRKHAVAWIDLQRMRIHPVARRRSVLQRRGEDAP
jgi:hypothetical protein